MKTWGTTGLIAAAVLILTGAQLLAQAGLARHDYFMIDVGGDIRTGFLVVLAAWAVRLRYQAAQARDEARRAREQASADLAQAVTGYKAELGAMMNAVHQIAGDAGLERPKLYAVEDPEERAG